MKCAVGLIIDQLGDRWKLHLLHQLAKGAQRTQTLLAELEGISSRTLSAKLKALEAERWISRRVYPEVPPHVEYELTEKGRALLPLLAALRRTGEALFSRFEPDCPSCQKVVSSELASAPPLPGDETREAKPRAVRPRQPDDDVVLL